jgi:hypothetical protein
VLQETVSVGSPLRRQLQLIVSDQGLGDETGEGTDFIVVTR